MKQLRLKSRVIAVAMVCTIMLTISFSNQVAFGATTSSTPITIVAAAQTQEAAFPAAAAAVAAGVALYAGMMVSAYELGTIVGHAAYDLMNGSSAVQVALADPDYNATDFSKFDN